MYLNLTVKCSLNMKYISLFWSISVINTVIFIPAFHNSIEFATILSPMLFQLRVILLLLFIQYILSIWYETVFLLFLLYGDM